MSGLDVQFNIAKGRVGQYFDNVELGTPGTSRITVVPLEASGLEADATLMDHDNLSVLLAASNNEQLANMGRKTLTAAEITVTVNDANDRLDITMSSITWAAATGNACGKLLFCYNPATSADTAIIPLLAYSFDAAPDGSDIVVSAHANGLIRFS